MSGCRGVGTSGPLVVGMSGCRDVGMSFDWWGIILRKLSESISLRKSVVGSRKSEVGSR